MFNGFSSDRHRQDFEAARDQVRRGGPLAACCGARLRSGGVCGHPPVEGSRRCRMHCGPVASRRLRAREIERLAAGDLDHETFVRNEARRAANRLRDVWRRQPWTPGATLDLGTHEHAFADAMAGAGYPLDRLAPAIADAARWRWRRTMVDRRDHAGWLRWATTELPRRVEASGRPPEGWSPTDVSGIAPAFVVPDNVVGLSKRRALDTPRVQQPRVSKPDPHRVRALDGRPVPGEVAEAARGVAENHEVLSKWSGLVRDEADLLVLWRGYTASTQGDYETWEAARASLGQTTR